MKTKSEQFQEMAYELSEVVDRCKNISYSDFEKMIDIINKMVEAYEKSILENERLMDMIIDLEDWTKNSVTKTEDSK